MSVDIRTKSGKIFCNVDVLTVADANDNTKLHKFVYSETVEAATPSKAEEVKTEEAEQKTSKRGKKNGSRKA